MHAIAEPDDIAICPSARIVSVDMNERWDIEPSEAIEKAFEQIRRTPIPPGPGPERVGETLKAVDEAVMSAQGDRRHERSFPVNRISKIAAAVLLAVGIAAVMVVLNHGNGGASIALADVVEAMKQPTWALCTVVTNRGTTKEWYSFEKQTQAIQTDRKVSFRDHRQQKRYNYDPKDKRYNHYQDRGPVCSASK